MKKIIFILVIAASVTFAAFAEAPLSFGIRAAVSPNWFTGGKKVAARDLAYAEANDFFKVSGIKASNVGIGFGINGYIEYDFTQNMGIEVDVSGSFAQGYTTSFTKEGYDSMYWSRTYSTYEIAPMFKYLPANGDAGYFALCVGPNIVIAPNKATYSISSATVSLDPIQNKFNFGVIAGIDSGIALSETLVLTYSAFVTVDLLRAYNPEVCQNTVVLNNEDGQYYTLSNLDAQFAKDAGYRIAGKFSMGMTYRIPSYAYGVSGRSKF